MYQQVDDMQGWKWINPGIIGRDDTPDRSYLHIIIIYGRFQSFALTERCSGMLTLKYSSTGYNELCPISGKITRMMKTNGLAPRSGIADRTARREDLARAYCQPFAYRLDARPVAPTD